MIGEIDIYGVYIPSLLLLMLIAFAATSLLRLLLGYTGLYRIIWHRSLFNFALFVIVLGVTVALTQR
ncbi:DUF1656 domain-containing protein [Vogesella sp. LIG4]|uniref:DUF1656 domain-containing protein n=1 Tax=Vogesella sp. LIG4 TaxID=1192162 RepID=UPI00081FA74C|nr:DUF1656 domain-containing protein [Vogesella sp. LIG4]SCK18573.1 Protein of unknown function [Vogesella sp. LIG4]